MIFDELLRPDFLVYLFAAPALLLLGLFSLALRREAVRRLVSEKQRKRFFPRFSTELALVRVLLASAALALGVLALVGPVNGFSLRDVSRKGLDLVVCLDTSRSMLVQDIRPDRLTRAKREVKGLLDRLQGDRIALIAFSGDVRNEAPLTHDRETLRLFVDGLSTEDNLIGGTNLGAALEHALQMFDGRTGAHEAILLITDGEDLEGQGRDVAERAAEVGIRIYVVGMGTEDGGKIPDGRGFVRDELGTEVISALDGSTLRAIAETTGGAYIEASRSATPLEELYEKRVSRMESRDLWAGKERIPHDRFQWPLVLALVCMIAEAALRERRPRSDSRRDS